MTYECIRSEVVSKFVPRAEQSNVQFTAHSAKYELFKKNRTDGYKWISCHTGIPRSYNALKIAQQAFRYQLSWKRTYFLSDVNLRLLSHSVSGLDWLHSVTMWPAGLKHHTLQTYIQSYIIWHFAVHKWAYNNSLSSKLYRPIQGQHHVRSLSGPRINYTLSTIFTHYHPFNILRFATPPPQTQTQTHTQNQTHLT